MSDVLCYPQILIAFKNYDSPWHAWAPYIEGMCKDSLEEIKGLVEG
jgi:hypothetical protein